MISMGCSAYREMISFLKTVLIHVISRDFLKFVGIIKNLFLTCANFMYMCNGYFSLSDEVYSHESLNHSQNFVSPLNSF